MKSLHQTLKGIMALLLAMSLTACLTPFGDVSVPGDNTNTTGSTNTGGTTTSGGGVSCNSDYNNTTTMTQCATYSSTSGVTSCPPYFTAVSSCTGWTHRCVTSSFTMYYGGTDAALGQSACSYASGTWY